MELLVEVYAHGKPVPQGSLASGRNGMYWSNSATLRPWRKTIVDVVQAFMPRDHVAVDTAIMVEVEFYFSKGKYIKNIDKLSAPDLDKLQRAVGDALTETGIYTDDARIVKWVASKAYETETQKEGAVIKVWKL